MPVMIQLGGDGGRRQATVTIDDAFAARPAIDFVFDVLGAEPLETLVTQGVLTEADLNDMRALQAAIFDRDDEGLLIRDHVSFYANGREVNPDQPLSVVLAKVDQAGISYSRCDLAIKAPGDRPPAAAASPALATPAPVAAQIPSKEEQMHLFGKMLMLHRIATGTLVDVTKDSPFLTDLIAQAEKEQLLEINVKQAAYALSPAGQRQHDVWLDEAQELVKRYDIYSDVDVDTTGRVRFDSGVGQDWRVAAYELAGLDPFKARFLIGLNDGEWNDLENWETALTDAAWYDEIFAPIEGAPGVQEIGRDRLLHVMDEAKLELREDGIFN